MTVDMYGGFGRGAWNRPPDLKPNPNPYAMRLPVLGCCGFRRLEVDSAGLVAMLL